MAVDMSDTGMSLVSVSLLSLSGAADVYGVLPKNRDWPHASSECPYCLHVLQYLSGHSF